jgi:hypothetical protein
MGLRFDQKVYFEQIILYQRLQSFSCKIDGKGRKKERKKERKAVSFQNN